MANRELMATEGLRIPISRVDRNNTVVAPPVGGIVYKVTSGNPAQLEAVLGTMEGGAPAAVVRPLVMAAPGVSFKVEDNLGSEPVVTVLDIVSSATKIALGIAEGVSFRQEPPVPVVAKPIVAPVVAAVPTPAQVQATNAARQSVLAAKSPRTPAEEQELAQLNLAGPKP